MPFTGTDTDGQTIMYKDGKRLLWLMPFVASLIPVLAVWVYFATGNNPLAVLIPFLYLFAFIPMMDKLVGEDIHNPPEEVVPDMTDDRYYNRIAWAMILPHYLLFIGSVWFVGTQNPPLWAVIILVLGMGTIGGGAITLGHELGHKTNRMDRLMAKITLGVVGYGHFCIEHNRGHHVRVSTPEDCSSARMGENVYQFMLRDIPGAFKGGWEQEALRLRNRGLSLWHWENEILQSYAITFGVTATLVAWLGWGVLPFIIGHHFIAWYGLTQVNYIEHYGLKREKLPNGKYEPCQPRHSWNTNHLVSNLLSIHLQRHSDHHANPLRPYQALRNFDNLPRLPSGYPGCLGLAAIPPLWFRVMDPKVMDWAGGDITKVNVDPKAKERLYAEYEMASAA